MDAVGSSPADKLPAGLEHFGKSRDKQDPHGDCCRIERRCDKSMHAHTVSVQHGIVHGPVKGQSRHKGDHAGNRENRHGLAVAAGKELAADRKRHGSGKIAQHRTDPESTEQYDIDSKAHGTDETCLPQTFPGAVEDLPESHGPEEGTDRFGNDFEENRK